MHNLSLLIYVLSTWLIFGRVDGHKRVLAIFSLSLRLWVVYSLLVVNIRSLFVLLFHWHIHTWLHLMWVTVMKIASSSHLKFQAVPNLLSSPLLIDLETRFLQYWVILAELETQKRKTGSYLTLISQRSCQLISFHKTCLGKMNWKISTGISIQLSS